MGFKCGIVGLPNVGKSTLFNALTCAGAEAANFPFCTKDPNVGMVNVPDPRLQALSEAYRPQKTTPAVMQFVDIAGLVKGASQGEGLGNQFLSHIRETDAILHVVRCFEDNDISHVEGEVNPVRDAELIMAELIIKDLESVTAKWQREQKLANSGSKESKAKVELWSRLKDWLDGEKPATSLADLSEEESLWMRDLQLLTAKPMFFCANVREDEVGGENIHVKALKAYAEKMHQEVLTISGKIEAEISELEEAEKKDFLSALGLEESGLSRVIRKGYAVLGLQTYFTAGEKEVRAWTIPMGAKAPQAAGVIHSDFERGFIRAETLAYADFTKYGTWQKAKENGMVRTEGKEYLVQDGDIMHFLFNV